ncbi:MAG TPA: hypothetical protein VGD67_05945, partial [Pseudonocardiaceae bacterium]
MIICGGCGERNEDDAQFCRVCEAFLEWEGDRTAPRPVPATGGPASTAGSGTGAGPVGSPGTGSVGGPAGGSAAG